MRDETSPLSEPAAAPASAPAEPGLQFDRVEPLNGAPTELACTICRQPLRGEFWELNGNPACGPCQAALLQHFDGPIPWRTWGRVLLMGGGAALLGTLIYFAVLKLTGYELGLIAVVVGLLVGGGVRRAAGQRGGWKLQAVAMALTYASIVSSYIPSVYSGLVAGEKDRAAKSESASAPSAQGTAAVAGQPASGGDDQAAPSARTEGPNEKPPVGLGRMLGGLLLAGLVLFLVACAAPFLAGLQNIMGLIIIGIALYEAWKLNRRVPLVVRGPIPIAVAGTAAAG